MACIERDNSDVEYIPTESLKNVKSILTIEFETYEFLLLKKYHAPLIERKIQLAVY
jgi:hypothetical protein